MIRFANIGNLPDNYAAEMLGLIPSFLSESDPRPAVEQFHSNYAHGGGWHELRGFKFDPATQELHFPGDAPLRPIALARLRKELIFVYPHAWVLILQPNGDFSVARMD